MIFYENKYIKKIIKEDYENCRSFNERNPIYLYFIVSEHLKNFAKEKALLDFKSQRDYHIIEPSLVYIGGDYGEILEVNLGGMKKLISKTIWNVANRCKMADRMVKYEEKIWDGKTYYKLPIKTQD